MNALGVLAREQALLRVRQERWAEEMEQRRIDELQARKSAAYQALEKEAMLLRAENVRLRSQLSWKRPEIELPTVDKFGVADVLVVAYGSDGYERAIFVRYGEYFWWESVDTDRMWKWKELPPRLWFPVPPIPKGGS